MRPLKRIRSGVAGVVGGGAAFCPAMLFDEEPSTPETTVARAVLPPAAARMKPRREIFDVGFKVRMLLPSPGKSDTLRPARRGVAMYGRWLPGGLAACAALLLSVLPAQAQVDIVGTWQQPGNGVVTRGGQFEDMW